MITASQIRAARSFFNLEQQVIADHAGVSKMNISEIENEKTTAKSSTINAIQKFFEMRGLEFTKDGGIRPTSNIVQIFEGNDAYLRLLDNVMEYAGHTKTLLKFGVDERKSSPEVIQKNRDLRASGISMKNLIENGNTYLLGRVEEYRYMPASLVSGGDVKLIYGSRVAYYAPWQNVPKVIIIHDERIAVEQTRLFEFVWDVSKEATETSASVRYEE